MKNLAPLFLLGAATLAAQSSVTLNSVPSREFGQPMLPPGSGSSAFNLPSTRENFVEGREFSSPLSIAFDNSVNPPIVYVADTFNNRVLAWRNAASISKTNFADKVIGQNSLLSTNAGGPGTGFSTGLFLPAAVAVDAKGNLYVADEGNNRVVRYPAPFNQTGDLLPIDLVIGQKTLNSGNAPNEGSPIPSQKSLFLYSGQVFTQALVFDAQGNLWVTDPGNNRVLRFPVGSLSAGVSEPSADLVLGQNDFTTRDLAPGFNQRFKASLYQPGGLAFDQAGRLYVSDSGSRVLQFVPGFVNGASAARILGVPQVLAGQTTITYPSNYTLGTGGAGGSPEGVFTIGNNLFVCDSPVGRIVRYDEPQNWPQESTQTFSPPALTVIGQPSFNTGKSNQGLSQPSASTLAGPSAGAVFNNGAEIWIVDTLNNRVIALPSSGNQVFGSATRVLGQLDYIYGAPNLVEGRELFLRSAVLAAGGVVVDTKSNPPHLYVADTFNNRVLGFNDARQVGTDARTLLTQKANLVIGQPDLFTTAVNYPSPDPSQTNDSGLSTPIGLAVDGNGNLYVADSGNARILRFPSPFSQSPGSLQHANLVLGQSSFTGLKITDPSSGTMSGPWGLALFSDGSLAASDVTHNRVLLFKRPSPTADFSSGQSASIVLGQTNFNSTSTGTGPAGFNGPRHIASDTSDRLYVADPGNGRLQVFTRVINASSGATSSFTLPGLNNAQGVTVSSLTGEIWVANTSASQVLRFPEFTALQANGATPTATLPALGPLSIALDASDNVVVLEGTSRMTFYYPSLAYRHVASFNQVPLAPGMLASLYLGLVDNSSGSAFTGIPDGAATAYPWPTTLSDVQVKVSGTLAPIFKIVSGIVYFQVPSSAPDGGTADFVVTKVSTGQIVASGTFNMQRSSPGFFTANNQGTGQVSALNADDNSVNTPSSGVARGHLITLYLTGLGATATTPPPDGAPRTGPTPGAVLPVIRINGITIAPADIQYSGLADFPGGWQINVKVPETTPPGNKVSVVVTENDVNSNVGPNGQQTVANGLIQTITVK